ncbi:MAG: hypothetical protein EAX81_05510 [Candidatus Thorarchaeota archaeon]|nr:hypothetical protein [Candidatus Thorarchaeota archaeon]
MRGRKGRINSPSGILSTAIYMGLVALCRISRNRASKKTRKFHRSIEKMWASAREDYKVQKGLRQNDFSPIKNAEPNMRGQFLKFVWTSTKRYGNKEFKRVYSWLEGTVGPLNALLNYAGACLRDLAMVLYPFPQPQRFQIREWPNGTRRILTESEASEITKDGTVKVHWRSGYERNGKNPRVLLSHPTLPSLDFVDMIRTHCVELCRQCFIYHVPRTEAHRYIRLLIHRLKPFLDWIYTNGQEGRSGFNPHADHELRKMVLEIRSLYRKSAKTSRRISGQHNEKPIDLSLEKIRQKGIKQLEESTDAKERKLLQKFLNYIDTASGVVARRDIEKLIGQILALSSREGTTWHRVLLSDLHHPKSLRQVIFSGDQLLTSFSSILIVAELPVAGHSGRVDLTIFIRREIAGEVLWTPVMILEIKTKATFDFNLYGFELKRKRKHAVTPAFYAWKRTMTGNEWQSIVNASPDPDALNQLRAYEQELIAEYRQLAAHDPAPPSSLWKGVIVLDAEASPEDIFPAVQFLLEDLKTGLLQQLIDRDSFIAVTPKSLALEGDDPRVSLLVSPARGPTGLLGEMEPPTSLPIDDPFADRESDDRLLTLYVSIPSPTSSGVTAARLSRNWHLLHHIQECIETISSIEDVVWLDLMGDYKSDELVKKRFGLHSLRQEKMISKKSFRELTSILQSIRFLDLSPFMNGILTEGAQAFSSLLNHIAATIPAENGEQIIILDGWTDLQDMIPRHQQHLLRILERKLLHALPQSNVNIIWIDDGVPHTKMNPDYQRQCISPLRYDSLRKTHVDEFIYNMPIPSPRFWWTNPQHDDIRIIVQDTPTRENPWKTAIYVPQLSGLAEKFRGLAKRDRVIAPKEIAQDLEGKKPMYGRDVTLCRIHPSSGILSEDELSDLLEDALTLVPSTLRERMPRLEEECEEIQISEDAIWQSVIQTTSSASGSTMEERMRIDVTRPPPRPGGTDRYIDVLINAKRERITRSWSYDQTPKQFPDDADESYLCTFPPELTISDAVEIDSIETRERELGRLKSATRYLKQQTFLSQKLRKMCRRIERHCNQQFALIKDNPSLKTSNFFFKALKQVETIILEDTLGATIWETLRSSRQELLDVLNSDNRQFLEEVMKETPDALLLYGNNLVLAIVSVLKDSNLSLAKPLWESVARWTLYQIGMNSDNDITKTVYSFRAILSNLRARINTLSHLNLPEMILEQEQVGAIIWMESEARYDALLLISHDNTGFLIGIIEGLNNRWIPAKWHSCKTTPQQLKHHVQNALTSTDRTPVITTTVRDLSVLLIPALTEDDELVWSCFSLKHGRPSGRRNSIPWIKLEPAESLAAPSHVPEIPDEIDETLRKIIRVKHSITPVKLLVGIDEELEVYEVQLTGEGIEERRKFRRTREAVRFLRTPIREGVGYRWQGQTLTWDHRKDIDYGDSLSFLRPLIHRSKFYPDIYHYPKTCKDLLTASKGHEIIMVISQEGPTYRVKFQDLPDQSALRELEIAELDIHALGLLAECKELFDLGSRTWHPLVLDVNAIMDLWFPKLHEYPRLIEAIQAADVNEFNWSRETWFIEIRLWRNELRWCIMSKTTGLPWMNREFTYILTLGREPDKELEAFKEVVTAIVQPEHLCNLDDELETYKVTLKERYSEYLRTVSVEDADERKAEDELEKAAAIGAPWERIAFRYSGMKLRRIKRNTVVVVSLVSGEEEAEVYVVRDVQRYVNESRSAGAIHSEPVDDEVKESLADYEFEKGELERIKAAVRKVLEEEGVRFSNEQAF